MKSGAELKWFKRCFITGVWGLVIIAIYSSFIDMLNEAGFEKVIYNIDNDIVKLLDIIIFLLSVPILGFPFLFFAAKDAREDGEHLELTEYLARMFGGFFVACIGGMVLMLLSIPIAYIWHFLVSLVS